MFFFFFGVCFLLFLVFGGFCLCREVGDVFVYVFFIWSGSFVVVFGSCMFLVCICCRRVFVCGVFLVVFGVLLFLVVFGGFANILLIVHSMCLFQLVFFF